MGLIFIRTIIVFITLLIIMRLMGKRQIGEMQPFELVITLLICRACVHSHGGHFHSFALWDRRHSDHLFSASDRMPSRPRRQTDEGTFERFAQHRSQQERHRRYAAEKGTISTYPTSWKVCGERATFSLDAVDYALYEANGSFSALPKAEYADMQSSLPVILIDEGKFDEKNIGLTKKSKSYFLDVLKEHGCKNEKQILIMTVDGDGKVYLQKKGERYTVFELKWEEKIW